MAHKRFFCFALLLLVAAMIACGGSNFNSSGTGNDSGGNTQSSTVVNSSTAASSGDSGGVNAATAIYQDPSRPDRIDQRFFMQHHQPPKRASVLGTLHQFRLTGATPGKITSDRPGAYLATANVANVNSENGDMITSNVGGCSDYIFSQFLDPAPVPVNMDTSCWKPGMITYTGIRSGQNLRTSVCLGFEGNHNPFVTSVTDEIFELVPGGQEYTIDKFHLEQNEDGTFTVVPDSSFGVGQGVTAIAINGATGNLIVNGDTPGIGVVGQDGSNQGGVGTGGGTPAIDVASDNGDYAVGIETNNGTLTWVKVSQFGLPFGSFFAGAHPHNVMMFNIAGQDFALVLFLSSKELCTFAIPQGGAPIGCTTAIGGLSTGANSEFQLTQTGPNTATLLDQGTETLYLITWTSTTVTVGTPITLTGRNNPSGFAFRTPSPGDGTIRVGYDNASVACNATYADVNPVTGVITARNDVSAGMIPTEFGFVNFNGTEVPVACSRGSCSVPTPAH